MKTLISITIHPTSLWMQLRRTANKWKSLASLAFTLQNKVTCQTSDLSAIFVTDQRWLGLINLARECNKIITIGTLSRCKAFDAAVFEEFVAQCPSLSRFEVFQGSFWSSYQSIYQLLFQKRQSHSSSHGRRERRLQDTTVKDKGACHAEDYQSIQQTITNLIACTHISYVSVLI